jgi:tetratricopeptide (TPR) repeat protein
MRAITENKQDDNPGAWYYLGRYYTEQGDAWGADTAFARVVEMAPQCRDDVGRYVWRLYPEVRTAALRTWQEGRLDSAVILFELGQSMAPDDAELPLFMAMMFVSQQQLDSASKYLERGVEIAGDDPAFEPRLRQAMLDVTLGYEAVAFENPAVSQIVRARMRRDSLVAAIQQDSARLAALNTEWAGRNLRPDVRQAVQRDSTALATKIASARSALPDAQTALERDSASATEAFTGALRAYGSYLERFPDDTEATLRVLRRHSLLGHRTSIRPLIEQVRGEPEINLSALNQVGTSLFNDGMREEAISVLEIVTERSPYNHDALYVLARAHYAAHDGDNLRTTTARLLEVDPLNPQSVRMMAAAWDLAGERDSVQKYVALADSGLGWGVTVMQFMPTESTVLVNGSVVNMTPRALAATTLVFEFMDAQGTVLATSAAEVPPLEPRQRHALTVRANVTGAVAWRYHR